MVIVDELFDKIKKYFENEGGYNGNNFLHSWIFEDLIETNNVEMLSKLFNYHRNLLDDFISCADNDYSHHTTKINFTYKEEKNPLSQNYNPHLIYIDEVTRFEKYHLRLKNGKFYKGKENQPIWISNTTNGEYNFAMDKKGNIFIHKKKNNEIFQHSSFLSGGDVVCAGYFELKNDGFLYIEPVVLFRK